MEFEKRLIMESLQSYNDSYFSGCFFPAREEKKKDIIFHFLTNNPLPLMASFSLGFFLVTPS